MNGLTAIGLLCGGAILTAATVPGWRRFFRQRGWVDTPGARKIHHAPIALAGGFSVLSSLLILLAGCQVFRLSIEFPIEIGETSFLALLASGATAMTLLGWWDDRMELRPAIKFVGQAFITVGFLVAVGMVEGAGASALRLGLGGLFVLAATNAFNFLDNMNGLCAGLGTIASVQIGLLALEHQPGLALFAFALSGALLGFIPFNYPRASVFLGDSGSLLTGFCVSAMALALRFPAGGPLVDGRLLPILITAIPLLDMVWVVGLRWRLGKPFYVGDTNHLSHQLVQAGLSPQRAVLVLWVLASAVGVGVLWLRS